MRLLVTGDREWGNPKKRDTPVQDRQVVKAWIEYLAPDCVIEGEARGVDSLARDAAIELGIPVEKYPAQWTRYGKGAGSIRNTRMIEEGKPTFTLAFHDDLSASRGTKNMTEQLDKRHMPYLNITSEMTEPAEELTPRIRDILCEEKNSLW